eukprot:GHVO01021873.1.p1 GENE.GHVO01021873.1~~GHVO01021873.1.p1  ORF type:complete len:421 (+),score=56.67 GHVO01021873.1:489-1751(+)
MFGQTNIIAVVTAAEPKKVKIWDDRNRKFIGELRSRQEIQNVCLQRDVIALVTTGKVYLYQTETMAPLAIYPTCPNPNAICVTWTSQTQKGVWKLGCPGNSPGVVRVQTHTDMNSRATQVTFQAHESPLACLAFNDSGTMIATAGSLGTLIRVFSLSDHGSYITHELRRGAQPRDVTCLVFSNDSQFIAASSQSQTLHIFKLVDQPRHSHTSPHLSQATQGYQQPHPTTDLGAEDAPPRSHSQVVESIAHNVPAAASAVKRFVGSTGAFAAAKAAFSGGKKSVSSFASQVNNSLPPTLQNLNESQAAAVMGSAVVQSKEKVHDALKEAFPRYFAACRSFCQYHIPSKYHGDGNATSICTFLSGDERGRLALVHGSGVFYEILFDTDNGGRTSEGCVCTYFPARGDERNTKRDGEEDWELA